MAKLESEPNWGIVGRLKPPLDFYMWKGIWCVRCYPEHIKQPGTPEQKATWCAMLATVDDWNAQGKIDKKAWKTLIRKAGRTGRDFHGRLHLREQTLGTKPWTIYLLQEVKWIEGKSIIKFSSSTKAKPQIDWCFDSENIKAYWWHFEGYCMRGRKYARRYSLYENWENSKEWETVSQTYEYEHSVDIDVTVKKMFFSIRIAPEDQNDFRGRSGVYVFERGKEFIAWEKRN